LKTSTGNFLSNIKLLLLFSHFDRILQAYAPRQTSDRRLTLQRDVILAYQANHNQSFKDNPMHIIEYDDRSSSDDDTITDNKFF